MQKLIESIEMFPHIVVIKCFECAKNLQIRGMFQAPFSLQQQNLQYDQWNPSVS